MAVPEIDVDELAALDTTMIQLIDVREPDEFDEARVPGARLMPLMTVPDGLGDLDLDQHVYMICASGGRSHNAVMFLVANGFSATNVVGGTKAWVASGKDFESGPLLS